MATNFTEFKALSIIISTTYIITAKSGRERICSEPILKVQIQKKNHKILWIRKINGSHKPRFTVFQKTYLNKKLNTTFIKQKSLGHANPKFFLLFVVCVPRFSF